MSGFLIGHPDDCEFAQIFIDQRKKCLGGLGIALLDAVEDAGDITHARRLCDRHGLGNPERTPLIARAEQDLAYVITFASAALCA